MINMNTKVEILSWCPSYKQQAPSNQLLDKKESHSWLLFIDEDCFLFVYRQKLLQKKSDVVHIPIFMNGQ